MLIAMGIAAFFCIGIGVFPGLLFELLPYAPTYNPYSFGHIVSALQLLLFAILAFMLLIRFKVYPSELRSTNLDFDWFYRVPLKRLILAIGRLILIVWNWSLGIANDVLRYFIGLVSETHSSGKVMARTTASSTAVVIIVALLGVLLVFLYQFPQ